MRFCALDLVRANIAKVASLPDAAKSSGPEMLMRDVIRMVVQDESLFTEGRSAVLRAITKTRETCGQHYERCMAG